MYVYFSENHSGEATLSWFGEKVVETAVAPKIVYDTNNDDNDDSGDDERYYQ